MSTLTLARIEFGRLSGNRPRSAGCNARLGVHGQSVRTPMVRITDSEGAQGFGWSNLDPEQAQGLIGAPLSEAVDPRLPVGEPQRAIEYPLLDWAARRAGLPVYAFVSRWAPTGPVGAPTEPHRVPCYDTSLYMDDLHLADESAAAALIAAEAAEGLARGHRAFKIKVGRGAMHMPVEEGTRRDIAVIRAVRAAVGPGRLMIDANNGYTLNLAKRVLAETAAVGLYWLEEAFHEDPRLYENLKGWLAAQGLATLIADGEGDASPRIVEYVQQGWVDVLQYDIRRPGFSRWLELGPQLDAWGARSAPHNYGEPWGNYATCHLAAAIRYLEMVEWDEAPLEGLDTSAYRIADGVVTVAPRPGFGLALDEPTYQRAVAEGGYRLEA
jgi:L-alanine-DL-glutamate epimerase-like enolase superfamily enzyme